MTLFYIVRVDKYRVGLVQLVRFLMVELIHTCSNPRFNIGVAFTTNYYFSGRRRPVDNEVFLVTDFVNLKIKPAQSFRCVHKSRVCVRIFIGVSACMCMSICVFTVFLKKLERLKQKEKIFS
jgi:hypothetical protein